MKILFKFLFAINLVYLSLPSKASYEPCSSSKEVIGGTFLNVIEIYRALKHSETGFTGKNTCSLDQYPIRIIGTLSLEQKCTLFYDFKKLENLSFKKYGKYFEKYFEPTIEASEVGSFLTNYIFGRVKTIRVGNVSGALAANLGLASRLGSVDKHFSYGEVILTEDYFKEPSIKRIGTLIHEARHSDEDASLLFPEIELGNSHAGHVECRVVSFRSSGAKSDLNHIGCDQDISGPYGFEAIFYANILNNCTNCFSHKKNEKLRRFQIQQGYNHSIGNILEVPHLNIQ